MADGAAVMNEAKANWAQGTLADVRSRYAGLAPNQRLWLTTALGVILAGSLAMMWWAGRPDWRLLFSGLEGKDLQQVSQELAAAGIPFQNSPEGIEVPAEQLDKARMEVAAKGMPQSGRLGFELFDKPNWVGSEFDERVNYQRALEGELEHTIETLGVVRSARVHLVLPQPSFFASEEKLAKASVVLKLKRNDLKQEQIESIRNLVAGAVENLNPEQVTLIDSDGRANLEKRSGSAEQGDVEQAMESRLVAMLEPLAGVGNVRASVHLTLDRSSEERTDEIYDPTQVATLSSEKSEQITAGAPARASGVPGTASNSPAAAPAGAVQGSEKAAAPGVPPLLKAKDPLPVFPQAGGAGGQTTRQENGTFAVTRHTIHAETGPGQLRRLTVAVVVNDRELPDVSGKGQHSAWKARSVDEMHRLELLAQAAVGFDVKRGDQVVVENIGFSSNGPEAKSTGLAKVTDQLNGLLHTQAGLVKTALTGLLGVLLILLVLRPVATQVIATLKEPPLLPAGVDRARLLGPGEEEGDETEASDVTKVQQRLRDPRLAAGESDSFKKIRIGQDHEVYDRVSAYIKQDAQQSTRLLETWIGSTEGGL